MSVWESNPWSSRTYDERDTWYRCHIYDVRTGPLWAFRYWFSMHHKRVLSRKRATNYRNCKKILTLWCASLYRWIPSESALIFYTTTLSEAYLVKGVWYCPYWWTGKNRVCLETLFYRPFEDILSHLVYEKSFDWAPSEADILSSVSYLFFRDKGSVDTQFYGNLFQIPKNLVWAWR